MNENTSLRWIAVVTAEKVEEARKELGLNETATLAELKRKYRMLAKKWHPDVCAEEDSLQCRERFRKIAASKNLLLRLVKKVVTFFI